MSNKCLIFLLASLQLGKSIDLFGVDTGHKYITNTLRTLPDLTNLDHVEEKWIKQPLDHFNPNINRSWQMRYFQNLELFQPNAPIFLFIGGEGPAEPGLLTNRMLIYELAQRTNGAMFTSEHRFYGKSLPLDLKPQNLKYLSSQQALADLAYLIVTLKSNPNFAHSKVVVIGASYSGNLAAWMRQRYPHLVDMAYASSAPVLAVENFHQYYEKVAHVLQKYGSMRCIQKIARMIDNYQYLLNTGAGLEKLNICKGTDMRKPENRGLFFMSLLSQFAGACQNGGPKEVKNVCDKLEDSFRSSDVFFKTNALEQCYIFDVNSAALSVLNDPQMYSWIYQTCSEFGYFQTTIRDDSPFRKTIPVELYEKMCSALYGPQFNSQTINRAVDYTNQIYGGLNPNVTKVVFINGEMDPFGTLGIQKYLSDSVPAIMIPGSSHCKDIFSRIWQDSSELSKAKEFVVGTILGWLRS